MGNRSSVQEDEYSNFVLPTHRNVSDATTTSPDRDDDDDDDSLSSPAVAVCCQDDSDTQQELLGINAHTGQILWRCSDLPAAISRPVRTGGDDRELLLCGRIPGVLVGFDLSTTSPSFVLSGHTAQVNDAATLSLDDQVYASCSSDSSVRIWRDSECVSIVSDLHVDKKAIHGLAYLPRFISPNFLFSTGDDAHCVQYDLAKEEVRCRMRCTAELKCRPVGIEALPGNHLITCSTDTTCFELWDLRETSKPQLQWQVPTAYNLQDICSLSPQSFAVCGNRGIETIFVRMGEENEGGADPEVGGQFHWASRDIFGTKALACEVVRNLRGEDPQQHHRMITIDAGKVYSRKFFLFRKNTGLLYLSPMVDWAVPSKPGWQFRGMCVVRGGWGRNGGRTTDDGMSWRDYSGPLVIKGVAAEDEVERIEFVLSSIDVGSPVRNALIRSSVRIVFGRRTEGDDSSRAILLSRFWMGMDEE